MQSRRSRGLDADDHRGPCTPTERPVNDGQKRSGELRIRSARSSYRNNRYDRPNSSLVKFMLRTQVRMCADGASLEAYPNDDSTQRHPVVLDASDDDRSDHPGRARALVKREAPCLHTSFQRSRAPAKAGEGDADWRKRKMPFDGTDLGFLENHTLTKLGAVEPLLATEQQWCKFQLRDRDGRHCLLGAMQAVKARQMLEPIILRAARKVGGKHYWRIEFFNDDSRTSHADILRVLSLAQENIVANIIKGEQTGTTASARRRRQMRPPRSSTTVRSTRS